MEILQTKGLIKSFGSIKAVNDTNIVISSGKIYGLLGPNGSGKSTLMRLIAGLYRPSSGEILVGGKNLDYKDKAHIAYMPTESFFYSYMSIKNVKNYYADFFEDFDCNEFIDLLSTMGLDENMKITSLSSGMNAKLRVALTMARKAKIFMLDEPLNGIDLVARDVILKSIIKQASDDNAIIISSHLIDTMESVLDDVIFIKKGKVVLFDNAENAREKHQKSIVELYREVYATC